MEDLDTELSILEEKLAELREESTTVYKPMTVRYCTVIKKWRQT
jgi:hypothetical protein